MMQLSTWISLSLWAILIAKATSSEQSDVCPSMKAVCPTRYDPTIGQSVQLVVKNVHEDHAIRRLSDMSGIGQGMQRIYCAIPACLTAPCMNGGLCQETLDGFNCTCQPGFTGARCHKDIDECASNPCLNGAPCTDGINGYTCLCVAGYGGPQCQNNINECASNPCLHGATCTDGINGYTCSCLPYHVGTQCQTSTASANDLRVVGGSGSLDGRLEIFHAGAWGTVCDDLFDANDCGVACRQMGYIDCGSFSTAGNGAGVIVLDNLACVGSEQRLVLCPHNGFGIHNCGHHEDVGVNCATTVRLQGGTTSTGRVEIFYKGAWGTVCDDGWSNEDATVICRILGYAGGSAQCCASYGPGTGTIVLDNVSCGGDEEDIAVCPHNGLEIHNCVHGEDAGVNCYY